MHAPVCTHISTHSYLYTQTYTNRTLSVNTKLYLIRSSIMARKLALPVTFRILLHIGIKYHSISGAGHNLFIIRAR